MLNILLVVLCFIAADVVTGLTSAWLTRTVSSTKMRAGIQHKCGELFGMAAMYGIDYAMPLIDVAVPFSFTRVLGVYLVVMETISIFENIVELNPEISGPLGKLLEVIKEVTGNNGKN